MTPLTIFGIAPMNIGVESDSAISLPSMSKRPAPRSSDSRMIEEYEIRKRIAPISLAIDWNAPPITRMSTGVGRPGCRRRRLLLRPVQSMTMFPWRSISAVKPGRHDRRRVVLLDHGRAGDRLTGAQRHPGRRRRRERRAGAPSTSNTTSRSNFGARAQLVRLSISGQSSGGTRPTPLTRTLTMSISASKRWPYSRSWARWKASVVRATQSPSSIAPAGRLEAHLVALARVAAVRETCDDGPVAGEAVLVELPGRLAPRARRTCARVAPRRGWRSGIIVVATNSWTTSVASRPVADVIPGCGGTSTREISSSRAMSQANSGPAPPAATSVKSRGS